MVAASVVAFASATAAAAPWTFAGVKMGAPLAESNLPACPLPTSVSQAWAPPSELCIARLDDDSDGLQTASLDGLTALHWPDVYASSLFVWQGRVAAINIPIGHDAFPVVLKILETRYGKPAAKRSETVTSNGGAVASSAMVRWEEGGNTIEIEERCDRVDRSCVTISNDAVNAEWLASKHESVKADASIL
jgi:hypothetical protein